MDTEVYSAHIGSNNKNNHDALAFLNHIAKLIQPLRCKIANLNDVQKENIIYIDDEYAIIGNKNMVHNLCAVKDTKYNNKYLIVYTLYHCSRNEVYCFIVYFNDSWPHTRKYITQSIMNLSTKSSTPNSQNLYFHDDVLLMCDKFTEMQNFIFRFTKFSENYDSRCESYENVLWSNAQYSTPLRGNVLFDLQFSHLVTIEMTSKNTYDLCGWETQKFNQQNKKYVIIDMLSVTKNNDNVMFTTYPTDDYLSVLPTIVHVDKKMDTYDGYPLVCIKCKQDTSFVIAELYGDCKFSHTSCSLGHSFCKQCMIRYSLTNSSWVCCRSKLKDGNMYICENKINDTFVCDLEHYDNEIKIICDT